MRNDKRDVGHEGSDTQTKGGRARQRGRRRWPNDMTAGIESSLVGGVQGVQGVGLAQGRPRLAALSSMVMMQARRQMLIHFARLPGRHAWLHSTYYGSIASVVFPRRTPQSALHSPTSAQDVSGIQPCQLAFGCVKVASHGAVVSSALSLLG